MSGLVIELSSDSEPEQQQQQAAGAGSCHRLSPSARLLEGSLYAAGGSAAAPSNSSSSGAKRLVAAAGAGVPPAERDHGRTAEVRCVSSAAAGAAGEVWPAHVGGSMYSLASSPEAASPAPLRQRLALARAAAKPR